MFRGVGEAACGVQVWGLAEERNWPGRRRGLRDGSIDFLPDNLIRILADDGGQEDITRSRSKSSELIDEVSLKRSLMRFFQPFVEGSVRIPGRACNADKRRETMLWRSGEGSETAAGRRKCLYGGRYLHGLIAAQRLPSMAAQVRRRSI